MIPAVSQSEAKKLEKIDHEDCLQCRIVGTTTFTGVSLYALHLRAITPKNDRGNRLFFTCFSLGAAAVAFHRCFIA
jgi:hypothetical protein